MSWAWAFGSPPFWPGQAAGGVDPGGLVVVLGEGLAVGDGVSGAVGDGRARVAVAGTTDWGGGVDSGTATGLGWSANTTTPATAKTTAPMRRRRPITPQSVT